MVFQYCLQVPFFLSLCQVELVATESWNICKWIRIPIDVKDWNKSCGWLNSWRREGWHGDLNWLIRNLSKHSLCFEWILQRDKIVRGIRGETEAYEVNHYAYLHKICRCDDACIWDIVGNPSNAAGRNITLNASIMGQIHNPYTHR